MARAYNVHVVVDPKEVGEKAVKAVFTVKHELQTWLVGQAGRLGLEVVTIRDGGR